jgi:GntR family transcriptional regulator, transcriptional repressor for pyruvate dehydrogenase complex
MNDKFERVSRTSLADDLAERIVQMISGGEYGEGDRLPAIMEMARMFGVGHPTVREALKKLEIVGLIDIRHGSGVYVRGGAEVLVVSNPIYAGPATKKLLVDLIEARIPLEVKAAALAATEATDEHFERMERFLAEANASLDHDDDTLNAANMSFHREIAAASGNAVIEQLHGVLSKLFRREQSIILSIYSLRDKDHGEHREILDALRKRDPALAQELMQKHLEGVRDVLMRWDPEKKPLE